jgi:hypothetical protein
MKYVNFNRASAFFLFLIALLAAESGTGAQDSPKRETLSEELATLVRNKWEAIKIETSSLPNDEWAGDYRSVDGPTTSTHLAWSAVSGFMVWWENCSRPWQARVNYGRAEFTSNSLKLTPELDRNSSSSYHSATEFIPVKWGEQHFLIPSDKVINFAYAVNSTSVQEVESFFMKVADYEKPRDGLPSIPKEYREYLGKEPITGTISGFGAKVPGWDPKVILNAGRDEGVVTGMKFYLSRPGNIYMQLEVTSVEEHTAEAFVIMTTFMDDRVEDVKPKVGWKVTSRAPEDNWQYQP